MSSVFFLVIISFLLELIFFASSIYCSIYLRLVIRVRLDYYRAWKTSINWSGCLKNISPSSDESYKSSAVLIELKFWFCCYYFYICSSIFCLSSSLKVGFKLCKNNLYFLKFCKTSRLFIFFPISPAWSSSFSLIKAAFSFLSLVWPSAFFIAYLACLLFSFK